MYKRNASVLEITWSMGLPPRQKHCCFFSLSNRVQKKANLNQKLKSRLSLGGTAPAPQQAGLGSTPTGRIIFAPRNLPACQKQIVQ